MIVSTTIRKFQIAVSAALLMGLWSPAPSALYAQDIELLGRIHGTTPPPGYYERLESGESPFRFRRGLRRPPGSDLLDLEGAGGPPMLRLPSVLAGPDGINSPVEGDFRFPLVLGLYADAPAPPYTHDRVHQEFFTGPNSRGSTIPEFYREISGDRVNLIGETFDWMRSDLTEFEVAGGGSGLDAGSRVGEFILGLLSALESGPSVDWGRFDNDGPDGIPNSGDDDGFVDVLSVMHSSYGGECLDPDRDNKVWSHRASLRELTGQNFATRTPSAAGGVVRIDDYTIQPVIACNRTSINQIGVFAHELGHGFGLPDLYATGDVDHYGIGNWGLMGTGSFGCSGRNAATPCHMSAWSKQILGWVQVETLAPDFDGVVALDPVETSEKIYRIDAADGSGQYFLLENRQKLGFDEDLHTSGLLIYQVDPEIVNARWTSNSVNRNASRMGVWIRQADGLNDLAEPFGGRGDGGDPFPGFFGSRDFHAGTVPAARTHTGSAAGVTLLDIEEVGGLVRFRAVTGFRTITLDAPGEAGSGQDLFLVDGEPRPGSQTSFEAAPFEERRVEAVPGALRGPGVRDAFDGWSDGGPRDRMVVTPLADLTLAATYAGREHLFDIQMVSDQPGIEPATIDWFPVSQDGWFPAGTSVTATLFPRGGFSFRNWSGAFTGEVGRAEAVLTMPVFAAAHFDVTYRIVAPIRDFRLAGGHVQRIDLVVENANPLVRWSLTGGALPPGLSVDPAGRIEGVPLEAGVFPMTLCAVDGIGLEAESSVFVTIDPPSIPLSALTASFLLENADALSEAQKAFLDQSGNRNGEYDLGDLRAFLLRGGGG